MSTANFPTRIQNYFTAAIDYTFIGSFREDRISQQNRWLDITGLLSELTDITHSIFYPLQYCRKTIENTLAHRYMKRSDNDFLFLESYTQLWLHGVYKKNQYA
jgi:hypothetical protein